MIIYSNLYTPCILMYRHVNASGVCQILQQEYRFVRPNTLLRDSPAGYFFKRGVRCGEKWKRKGAGSFFCSPECAVHVGLHAHPRGGVRHALSWRTDSNHVDLNPGSVCVWRCLSCFTHCFSFSQEMMVKKEIEERRESLAKWDAWGRKVGKRMWNRHYGVRIALL